MKQSLPPALGVGRRSSPCPFNIYIRKEPCGKRRRRRNRHVQKSVSEYLKLVENEIWKVMEKDYFNYCEKMFLYGSAELKDCDDQRMTARAAMSHQNEAMFVQLCSEANEMLGDAFMNPVIERIRRIVRA